MRPLWVTGSKWYKQHLSYRLVNWPQHLPEPAVRGAVRAAFQLWSNVSALQFWEAPATGPADIRLTFFQGDHNDGLGNAFDGPGADTASVPRGRRGTQLGEVVCGGQWSICFPVALSKLHLNPLIYRMETMILPYYVPHGWRDGQMRFCMESTLQTLKSIIYSGRIFGGPIIQPLPLDKPVPPLFSSGCSPDQGPKNIQRRHHPTPAFPPPTTIVTATGQEAFYLLPTTEMLHHPQPRWLSCLAPT